MAKTTKTMKLTFLNGEKKKISITLGDAVDNLTADQVRGAMNTIAEANAFEKDGVAYYNDSKGTNPDAAIKGIQAMASQQNYSVLIEWCDRQPH